MLHYETKKLSPTKRVVALHRRYHFLVFLLLLSLLVLLELAVQLNLFEQFPSVVVFLSFALIRRLAFGQDRALTLAGRASAPTPRVSLAL